MSSPEFPSLETERLLLRGITLEDAPFWFEHFSDPEIVELTAYEAPRDLPAAREEVLQFCVRPFEEGRGLRWGILMKSQPGLIGTLGYHQWAHEGRRARVGYDLRKAFRRQGIMTEALSAVLGYGFGAMGLNRVEACTDPRNTASIHLLDKIGFHLDGVLRENTLFRGRFLDDLCFSLLAREWESRAPSARGNR
ncbi:MAG TPA: GNAT family protein [Thermoplasmata archaeon]